MTTDQFAAILAALGALCFMAAVCTVLAFAARGD
jgi:hypothetical protein